jgi:hypothetical protein
MLIFAYATKATSGTGFYATFGVLVVALIGLGIAHLGARLPNETTAPATAEGTTSDPRNTLRAIWRKFRFHMTGNDRVFWGLFAVAVVAAAAWMWSVQPLQADSFETKSDPPAASGDAKSINGPATNTIAANAPATAVGAPATNTAAAGAPAISTVADRGPATTNAGNTTISNAAAGGYPGGPAPVAVQLVQASPEVQALALVEQAVIALNQAEVLPSAKGGSSAPRSILLRACRDLLNDHVADGLDGVRLAVEARTQAANKESTDLAHALDVLRGRSESAGATGMPADRANKSSPTPFGSAMSLPTASDR